MCGIVGVYYFNREGMAQKSLLDAMCSSLKHRGPDGHGAFTDGGFGFGMTRLKVIDLDTGDQPIFNEKKDIGIVFNGEIYNYKELKKELISKGYNFMTKSDTEVILRAYEEYGNNYLNHLRGMFAIAIWDSKIKRLVLARDRVGKKPLFYYMDAKNIIFASEIKAILKVEDLDLTMDFDALNDYLHYGFIAGERTIYKNIRKLSPGSYMIVSGEGGKELRKYWEIPRPRPVKKSLEEWLEELDWQMKDAVKCRLISDVPLGVFLSGGIDSSLITSIMSEVSSVPIKSFTIGFQDRSYDESDPAKIASGCMGTSHFQKNMPFDISREIIEILSHFDEPFADSSALPTFILSRFARQNITVALSGEGGDEIFGGYQRYLSMKLLSSYLKLPKFLRKGFESFMLGILPEMKGYSGASNIDLFRQGIIFARRLRNNPNDLVPVFFEEWQIKELFEGYQAGSSGVEAYAKSYQDLDPVSQMMWTDFSTYLADDLLVKVDRMSMANSLEVRCPFLDHNLIEFMTTVPADLKIRGINKKILLKKYCENKLPKELIHRKKHGFSVPLAELLRDPLRPLIEDLLVRKDSIEFISHENIKTMISSHFQKQGDFSKQIWVLLVLAIWRDKNKIGSK